MSGSQAGTAQTYTQREANFYHRIVYLHYDIRRALKDSLYSFVIASKRPDCLAFAKQTLRQFNGGLTVGKIHCICLW